ncbi:MAG: chemotaxis protein CheW [Succinivibrionaceae bacterium]
MTQENQFAAMANYFRSMLTPVSEDKTPVLKPEIKTEVKPVMVKEQDQKTRSRLERIIDQVKPETAVAAETTPVETRVVEEVKEEQEVVPQEIWTNIEVPDDFQALFFVVNGVVFAVPLIDLGGISNMDKVTGIIGKPSWFMGMMNVREDKFNVVDFVKWSMPQATGEMSEFSYLIELGTSKWGITCHELIGTEALHRSQIQWRTCAGKRPWLAGLVKEKRCALIHVDELIKLFEKGININGN